MSAARVSIFRSLSAGILCGLALGGCVTEQGHSESSAPPGVVLPPESPPPVAPLPEPAPAPTAVIPGAGTLIPPNVTPPAVTQNYPKTIQDSNPGPAVLSLYNKAQEARAAGQAAQAEALLERAQRIDAHNPFIWQALAGTKLELLQPDQAEQFANRSNDLARGNPYIQAGNWRLIAAARQARGDAGGALQAQARADDVAKALSPQ